MFQFLAFGLWLLATFAAVRLFLMAAVCLNLLWRLLLRGPSAAAHAAARGASLRQWWSGEARPRQKSSTGLAGRLDPDVGVIAVETDLEEL